MFLAELNIALPKYPLDIWLGFDLVTTEGKRARRLEENCIHGSL